MLLSRCVPKPAGTEKSWSSHGRVRHRIEGTNNTNELKNVNTDGYIDRLAANRFWDSKSTMMEELDNAVDWRWRETLFFIIMIAWTDSL